MFQLVLVDSEPPEFYGSFENGQEAAESCRGLNDYNRDCNISIRWKVTRINIDAPDAPWRIREDTKLRLGEYQRTPWHFSP